MPGPMCRPTGSQRASVLPHPPCGQDTDLHLAGPVLNGQWNPLPEPPPTVGRRPGSSSHQSRNPRTRVFPTPIGSSTSTTRLGTPSSPRSVPGTPPGRAGALPWAASEEMTWSSQASLGLEAGKRVMLRPYGVPLTPLRLRPTSPSGLGRTTTGRPLGAAGGEDGRDRVDGAEDAEAQQFGHRRMGVVVEEYEVLQQHQTALTGRVEQALRVRTAGRQKRSHPQA